MIELSGVHKYFYSKREPFVALGGVDLAVEHDRFIVIVGSSGCGKSTVLNCISGLIPPDQGNVNYDGNPVTGTNSDVVYLSQHDALLPWLTVYENVALPLRIAGQLPASRHIGHLKRLQRRGPRDSRVEEALATVGLAAHADQLPRALSGGMLKRAGLAQMLVQSRRTVLMDEPFGALDFQLRLNMHAMLMNIWENERRTIVFVTHDLDEAITLADTVVVMAPKPGRIVDTVPVNIPRPRDAETIRFDPAYADVYKRIWERLKSAGTATADDQ